MTARHNHLKRLWNDCSVEYALYAQGIASTAAIEALRKLKQIDDDPMDCGLTYNPMIPVAQGKPK